MANFQRIATDVDVVPLLGELFRQPDLWGQNTARTAPGSPHEGVPDIWARTAPPAWFEHPKMARLFLRLGRPGMRYPPLLRSRSP